MTALPLSSAGAHETETEPPSWPSFWVFAVGAEVGFGGPSGLTGSLAEENSPGPSSLTARMVKEYWVPFESPAHRKEFFPAPRVLRAPAAARLELEAGHRRALVVGRVTPGELELAVLLGGDGGQTPAAPRAPRRG